MKPPRIIGLLVCTVIGAVAAYVLGVDQPGDANAPIASAQSESQQPPTIFQPEFEPPAWVNESESPQSNRVNTEMASYEEPSYYDSYDADEFVVVDSSSGYPSDASHELPTQQLQEWQGPPQQGLQPIDDVSLQEVPLTNDQVDEVTEFQPVTTADYVVPLDEPPFQVGPIASESESQDSLPQPNELRPEGINAQPLRLTINAPDVPDSASNEESYVVLNPNGSHPLATLKIGRTKSSRLSAAEMRRPDPIRPALPAIRETLPQASLFIEVNENDRTCAIKAQHVKLRDLLSTLGERSGVWITPTQHVGGLVSTDVQDVRIEEAIEEIAGPLGYSVGVRGDAILVGLHDEVSGYERRLSDFADFNNARLAAREAEKRQQQARLEQSRVRSQKRAQANAEQQSIALVSHSEAYKEPAKASVARRKVVRASAQAAAENRVARAVHSEPAASASAKALPMHAGPKRAPSTEAILEARRIKIASEEGRVVSVIAERAMNQIKAGQYRRVVNMLSQLVTEHQKSAQLFQLLGEAYYHCEQYDAAEYSLNHSLQLYKNDARTNYFLGCVLGKLGERQRSLHYLLQAHDIDPMYPPIVSKTALAPR